MLLAVGFALLLIAPAEAHAALVRSEPTAGALLQTAPKELVLEFSEQLDPGFSSVQLLDGKNQVVNAGPGTIDPAAPRVLHLTLGDLPKDSYTAIWQARSAVDGHVGEGSVPFGVGVASTTTSLIPPLGSPDPATLPPPPLEAVARWLSLLMAAVAFGGLPFGLLVWRPAFRAARHGKPHLGAADEAMTQSIHTLLLVGSVLFILTNVFFLVAQAVAASSLPLAQIGTPLLQLLRGPSGQSWEIRMSLTLTLILFTLGLPTVDQEGSGSWWLGLVVSGAVLLTFSLTSHGAALEEGATLAIVLDWLHIAAMVVWLGGLMPLIIAIRAARSDPEHSLPLTNLIPRFSLLAASCVLVLTLTGIYSYVLNINGLNLLAATTYGRALVVKLALFGFLLVLGGLNLFIHSPRLSTAGNRLVNVFGRTVRSELIAGALLLLAVGAMTSVAPSNIAWEEHERLGLVQEATEGDVHLVIHVAPAQIGDNEFAVDVTDNRPGAQAAATKVLLRFTMVGHTMGVVQTEANTTDTQRYTTRGSFTSMGGRWHVEVVLRRAGFEDIRHTFDLDIVRSASVASQ